MHGMPFVFTALAGRRHHRHGGSRRAGPYGIATCHHRRLADRGGDIRVLGLIRYDGMSGDLSPRCIGGGRSRPSSHSSNLAGQPHRHDDERRAIGQSRVARISWTATQWRRPRHRARRRLEHAAAEGSLATQNWAGLVVVQHRGKSHLHSGATRPAGSRRLLRRQNRAERWVHASPARFAETMGVSDRGPRRRSPASGSTHSERRDSWIASILDRSGHMGARPQTRRAAKSPDVDLPCRRWLSATRSSFTPAVRTIKASWPTKPRRANSAGRLPRATTAIARPNWPPSPGGK